MTPTSAQAVIDAVIQRLRQAISGASVESFPEKPQNFKPQARGVQILVTVDAWRWTPGPPPVREYQLTVALFFHSLKPGTGGPDLVDAVSAALVGWRPAGSGPIELDTADFIERRDGTHCYGLACLTRHPWAVGTAADLDQPLLTITVEGDADQQIPSPAS